MKALKRILRSLCGVVVVALLLFAAAHFILKLGGFVSNLRSLAMLSLAVAFSISRPHHKHGWLPRLLYDGAVLFFMLLAFRDVSELAGVFEAAFMRICGYMNLLSGSWISTAALAFASVVLFFVVGTSIPLFVILVVSGMIVLGGATSLEFSEETVEEDKP